MDVAAREWVPAGPEVVAPAAEDQVAADQAALVAGEASAGRAAKALQHVPVVPKVVRARAVQAVPVVVAPVKRVAQDVGQVAAAVVVPVAVEADLIPKPCSLATTKMAMEN